MAKRVRGGVRPGQRRSIERRAAGPAGASSAGTRVVPARPSGLTDDETQRAAEIEAQLVAQEREAEVARSRARARATRDVAPAGSIAVRAEVEYAYVARDVRRIVRIAAVLLSVLLVLWVLIDVARVIPIS